MVTLIHKMYNTDLLMLIDEETAHQVTSLALPF